ncbi:MAG: hypothetical protein IPJ84_02440 [Bdellovibrionales bacterium]|nr:hypothetical protein [Bdellovibrionales bacterium]
MLWRYPARTARVLNWTLVSWILMLGVGCASSSVSIKEVTLPLAVVRKIVMENIPGGTSSESMNGREIVGEYFDPKNLDQPADDQKERARATVTILGSRRPYQLQVSAVLERRRKGSKTKYDVVGDDRALAKKVRDRIKTALANRPADLNVIDDFRAF